ncbi:MAG: DUF1587 domain-containing protein, partial [Gemmataceae bacterium]
MRLFTTLICLSLPTLVSADDAAVPQALFQNYCLRCHDADTQKGKVRLDDISKIDPELWKSIFVQLANEEMPPAGKRMPTDGERKALMDYATRTATKGSPINAPGFRRLNQREYTNTVRDLLGLNNGTYDPGKFIYVDEVTDGFDTEAKQLVLSNELLVEYLNAADKSLHQALFTTEINKPTVRDVKVDMKKMDGTGGGRYISTTKDHAIIRMGGKGSLFASKESRTITSPGRYTITVTAAGIDRDRYPIRLTPVQGPIIMGFGTKPDGEGLGHGTLHKTFELKDDVDQTFTFDVWIEKGDFPYLTFKNGPPKPIVQIRAGIRRKDLPAKAEGQPYVGPALRVSALKIQGPFHDEWPPQSLR